MPPRSLAATAAATVVAAAGLALPADAGAAAFGPPVARTPVHGNVDSPSAAIAPNGRTAVLYRTSGNHSSDYQYRALIGPSPDRLSRPRIVAAGREAARSLGGATLLARRDGGFVACFGADERGRKRVSVGCSFAPHDGRFGRLHVVERAQALRRPTLDATVRPDGTTIVLVSTRPRPGRELLRTVAIDPRGRLGRPRTIGYGATYGTSRLAAADDGTVGVAFQELGRGGRSRLRLRVIDPGSDRPGPARALGETQTEDGPIRVIGGRELLVLYPDLPGDADSSPRLVRRRADGTFEPPVPLLGAPGTSVPGNADIAAVAATPAGPPLVVTSATTSAETDCSNDTSGIVGAADLGAPAATPLSAPGQIARFPQAATLADGTSVVAWANATGRYGGSERYAAAVRAPGAGRFSAGQPLPGIGGDDMVLAAGGANAIMAWSVGPPSLDGPTRLVTSALHSAPPYAHPTRLPPHPKAECS